MNGQAVRSGRQRWFVLFLIALMYFFSYLDRVNISAAAPVISREFGFKQDHDGLHLQRLRLELRAVPDSGRLAGRPVRPPARADSPCSPTGRSRWHFSAPPPDFRRWPPSGSSPASAKQARSRPRRGRCNCGFRGTNAAWCRAFPIACRLGAAIAPPVAVAIITAFGWRWVFYVCGSWGCCGRCFGFAYYRNTPGATLGHPTANSRTSGASMKTARSSRRKLLSCVKPCPGASFSAPRTCGPSCSPISPMFTACGFS